MKFSKPSIQFIKPIFQSNHFSSQKLHLDDVGPMASLLKTRTVVRFRGPDTITFLQGLLTNDIRKFDQPVGDEKSPNLPARSLYAAMLRPEGRFLYDMFLYEPPRTGSEHDELELLADVDCSVLDELVETLKKYRLKSKVDIEKVGESFSCWQLYGVDLHKSVEDPQAASVSTSNSTGWQWHKDPRTDCLGFRGIFPSNTIPPLVEADTETEEENYLLWRIQNGVAEGSIEIPKGTAMLLEYNLAGLNAISFDKGCYVGQELITRNLHRGEVVKRLFPIKFLDKSGKEVSLRVAPSTEVVTLRSGKKAGMVRTAVGSRGLALLRVNGNYEEFEDLVIKGEDVEVDACGPEWWPCEW